MLSRNASGHLGDVAAREEGSNDPIAVAMNEVHWDIEPCQAAQRLSRHRSGQNVSSDHDHVYSRRAHISKHSLEGRQVPMNVVQGCDSQLVASENLRFWVAGTSNRSVPATDYPLSCCRSLKTDQDMAVLLAEY
jgi:hypothetical protein